MRFVLTSVKHAVNVQEVTQGHIKVTACPKRNALSPMALFGTQVRYHLAFLPSAVVTWSGTNVVISAMIIIAVLESTVICPCVQKSANRDVNAHLIHIQIVLDFVFPLVTKLSVPWFKNVQITKFGMTVETAVVTFSAVQTKIVFLHLVPLGVILVVNVPVECTQVRTTLICA